MYLSIINKVNNLSAPNKLLLKQTYQQLFKQEKVTREMVAPLVAELPYLVFEDNQLIAIFGLDVRQTVHQIIINDVTLYAWCIWDAFFIAELLEQTASIKTADPVAKTSITASYQSHIHPLHRWQFNNECWVSFPKNCYTHKVDDNLCGCFCCYVHLFNDYAHADTFSSQNYCEVFTSDLLIQRGQEMLDAMRVSA